MPCRRPWISSLRLFDPGDDVWSQPALQHLSAAGSDALRFSVYQLCIKEYLSIQLSYEYARNQP